MAGKIHPLPGVNCASFLQGRCLYEERINPGLHASWRCQVLVRLEEEYDRFLDQAEHFSLDLRTAMNIWENRADALMGVRPPCGEYSPGRLDIQELGENERPEDAVLDCAHYWLGLCLPKLPPCSGVCPLFAPRKTQQTETG